MKPTSVNTENPGLRVVLVDDDNSMHDLVMRVIPQSEVIRLDICEFPEQIEDITSIEDVDVFIVSNRFGDSRTERGPEIHRVIFKRSPKAQFIFASAHPGPRLTQLAATRRLPFLLKNRVEQSPELLTKTIVSLLDRPRLRPALKSALKLLEKEPIPTPPRRVLYSISGYIIDVTDGHPRHVNVLFDEKQPDGSFRPKRVRMSYTLFEVAGVLESDTPFKYEVAREGKSIVHRIVSLAGICPPQPEVDFKNDTLLKAALEEEDRRTNEVRKRIAD